MRRHCPYTRAERRTTSIPSPPLVLPRVPQEELSSQSRNQPCYLQRRTESVVWPRHRPKVQRLSTPGIHRRWHERPPRSLRLFPRLQVDVVDTHFSAAFDAPVSYVVDSRGTEINTKHSIPTHLFHPHHSCFRFTGLARSICQSFVVYLCVNLFHSSDLPHTPLFETVAYRIFLSSPAYIPAIVPVNAVRYNRLSFRNRSLFDHSSHHTRISGF